MDKPQKIVTIVQARTGSSRLPGKVMLNVLGKPILLRMIDRIKASKLYGTLVVATTEEKENDVIANLCSQHGINCFRGSSDDLLDRHYQAAREWKAEAVVKIPSDCPLIDAKIIDKVLQYFLAHDFDYVSNLHPASYPDGNDVEVMKFSALEKAWKEATRPLEREHTTPYLWEHSEKFSLGNVAWETGLDCSLSHRWTLDYPEDFAFIEAVYGNLFPGNPNFSMQDILDLMERRPDIFALNSKYAGVNWYRHHLGELKTIGPEQTKII